MAEPCILIVEADIRARHPLAEYLRECGYKVIEAISVNEARDIVASDIVKVDAVLVDASESEKGGFVFADWARRQYPQIKVILAGTVAKVAKSAGELCEDGPSLTRPYDHQLVLDQIRRSLAIKKDER